MPGFKCASRRLKSAFISEAINVAFHPFSVCDRRLDYLALGLPKKKLIKERRPILRSLLQIRDFFLAVKTQRELMILPIKLRSPHLLLFMRDALLLKELGPQAFSRYQTRADAADAVLTDQRQ